MDNTKFGKFVSELRKEKNMTQKELAKKLNLTDKAISKWERGLSFPDITILNSLANELGIEISELLNGERGNKNEVDIDKLIKDTIEEINKTKEKRKKRILKTKKFIVVLSIIILLLSLILQTVYIFVLEKHGFEYVIDSMFYIVNQIIIVCISMITFLYVAKTNKIKNIIIGIICLVLTIINLIFLINNGLRNKSIISFSKNFANQLVLKQEKETGKITFYRNTILLFAKPRESFSYPSKGKIKTKWITNDICSITYKDPDGKLKEFVATYGDRGNGISYYYVTTAISGEWHTFTQNGNNTKLIVDSKGITIKKEGEEELFDYRDTEQFGTIALVLYKDDNPKYVIALNEDCKLNEQTDIIEKGGTISLFEISMEKTIVETLNCVTYKGDLSSGNYRLVDVEPYNYKIKNGILYIKYNENKIIEVPGEYSNMYNSYNKYNYQISDEKTVFFYKENDKIYLIYSDDKGNSWNRTELSCNSNIENIHFINAQIGFMLQFTDSAMSTAYGNISKTIDGGRTWKIISHGIKDSQFYSFSRGSQIKFFSEELGFLTMPDASGYSCKLYMTTDGANTFSEVKVPFQNLNGKGKPENIYDYYNLPKMEKGKLYLEIGQGLDGDYNGGDSIEYYSNDNGITWREIL